MEVNLRELEICFIAKSKNLQLAWDSNRNIFTFQSHKNTYAFFQICADATFYIAGFPILSSPVVILRDLEVCFIVASKLYNWRRIQIDMFVDI